MDGKYDFATDMFFDAVFVAFSIKKSSESLTIDTQYFFDRIYTLTGFIDSLLFNIGSNDFDFVCVVVFFTKFFNKYF